MTTNDTAPRTGRASVQKGSALVGIVFLVVGVAGFVPGITTHYSLMKFGSPLSGAQLLALFQVSVLHNLVHLLFGVAGIFWSRKVLTARNFLFYGGIVYFAFFFYGIVIEYQSAANFVPFDDADNVLHFVLGAGMIALSVLLDRGPGWRRAVAEGKATI
jgi:hypothetical protein